MTCALKALIVDDDPIAAAVLKSRLSRQFPQLDVVVRNEPDVSGAFDLYFLDNRMGDEHLAGQMARAIRGVRPFSFISVVSGHLDTPSLKQLINAGCDGAWDKSDAMDFEELTYEVDRFIQQATLRGERSTR